jgi:peptide/nickel transport system substrate-binding protein
MRAAWSARATVLLAATVLGCVLWAPGLTPASAAPIAEDSPRPGAGVKLRLGVVDGLRNLDLLGEPSVVAREVWLLTTDRLVGSSSEDLTPVPGLAESWSVSADGRTWTFAIRDDATWSDGRPVDAYDVVATYRAVLDSDHDLASGPLADVREVVAPDDHTVRIECSRTRADLLDAQLPILPRGSAAMLTEGLDPDTALIGSGPFRLAEWQPGAFVRLTVDPDYRGRQPEIAEVLLLSYGDAGTMARDLEAGLLDGAFGIRPGQAERLRSNAALTTVDAATGAQDRLVFNCSAGSSGGHPVLRDPELRRAVAWAVDTEAVARIAYRGAALPGVGVVPPGGRADGLGHRWQPAAEEAVGADLERAAALLDAAGYVDGDADGLREHDGEAISLRLLVSSTSKSDQRAAKLITGRLEQIGLEVTVEEVDPETIRSRVERRADGSPDPDFDLLIERVEDPGGESALLAGFASSAPGAADHCFWWSADYDRLHDAERAETDPAARRELLLEMQRTLYEQAPVIVLAYPQEVQAYNVSRWSGWVRSPADVGGAFFNGESVASYVQVRPAAQAVAADEGRSSRTEIAVAAGASAIVLLGAAGIFIWRRRTPDASAETESGGTSCDR